MSADKPAVTSCFCCRKRSDDPDQKLTDYDLEVKSEGRTCTDIFPCMFYVAAILAFIGIGIFVFITGDHNKLIYGTDYLGNVCNVDNPKSKFASKIPTPINNLGKPYLYYPRLMDDLVDEMKKQKLTDPTKVDFTKFSPFGICVPKCPDINQLVCRYDYDPVLNNVDAFTYGSRCSTTVQRNLDNLCSVCWLVPLETENILNRCIWEESSATNTTTICLNPIDADPTSDDCIIKSSTTVDITVEQAKDDPITSTLATVSGRMKQWARDLFAGRYVIFLAGVLGAAILGFIFLFLLSAGLASCVVWASMVGSVILCICLTVFCFFQGGVFSITAIQTTLNKIQSKLNTTYDLSGKLSSLNNSMNSFNSKLPSSFSVEDEQTRRYWYYTGWGMLLFTILLIALMISLAQKIKVAIAIIEEAAKCVQKQCTLVLYPVFTVVVTIGLFVWFLYSSALIKTIGATSPADIASKLGNVKLNTTYFNEDQNVANGLLWFNFAMFLWNINFVQGFGIMVISGVVGQWYYTRKEEGQAVQGIPQSAIFASMKRVCRYHLGSIAFGSLLITIVQLIRAILAYIDHQTKEAQANSYAMKCLMKVVQCCMYCFENCIKYIASNAYIITALRGTNFCSAAWQAAALILKQITQVGVLTVVTSFTMVVGKLFICSAATSGAYIYLSRLPKGSDIHNTSIPLGMTALTAYTIARSFLSIYVVAIDTILICFCEDQDKHAADPNAAFMGNSLRSAMNLKGEQVYSPKKAVELKDGAAKKDANEI